MDDLGVVRRTSVQGGGGQAAAPSEPATPSSIDLFKPSSINISSQPKRPPMSCVVVPANPGSIPGQVPTTLHRAVSLDTAKQEQEQQQQLQHVLAMQHQHPNQVQQEKQRTKASLGAQCDDVAGRISAPQVPSHSLGIGSDNLSTNGHTAVKTELNSLLASPNSGTEWEDIDGIFPFFDPIPPPQPSQPPLRGWSFDATHSRETAGGEVNSGNMVVDLSDVDNVLHLTEVEGKAAERAESTVSASYVGSGADAVAASRPEQGVSHTLTWASDGLLPLEKVVIKPSRTVSERSLRRDAIAGMHVIDRQLPNLCVLVEACPRRTVGQLPTICIRSGVCVTDTVLAQYRWACAACTWYTTID